MTCSRCRMQEGINNLWREHDRTHVMHSFSITISRNWGWAVRCSLRAALEGSPATGRAHCAWWYFAITASLHLHGFGALRYTSEQSATYCKSEIERGYFASRSSEYAVLREVCANSSPSPVSRGNTNLTKSPVKVVTLFCEL